MKRNITGMTVRRLTLLSCLVVLLSLTFSAVALAAPPTQEGAETCVECHEEETEAWQESPHGTDPEIVSCENCHGPYTSEHPETAIMELDVDSAACQDCHEVTYEQWEGTIHAEAGVQCIGCHQAHSQKFRLTDDQSLCTACHRDRYADFVLTAHGTHDVECIDCHVTPTSADEVSFVSNDKNKATTTPSHDFTQVSAQDCIKCHGRDVHQSLPVSEVEAIDPQILTLAQSVPELNARIDSAEAETKTLKTMVPVALGLGIGVGGVLGIIFMLVVNRINERRGDV